MKNILLAFLLLPVLLVAQYPTGTNKSRLGYQTTGDGLIWRGVAADTVVKPRTTANAYFQLDTVAGVLRRYIATRGKWQIVAGGGGSAIDSLVYSTIKGLNDSIQAEKQTLTFANPLLGISDGNNVDLSGLLGGYVTGSGTISRVPKWSATSNLTDSNIQDNGTAVSILSSKPFQFGQWTTAGRPSGTTGYTGFNTTLGYQEFYDGTQYLPTGFWSKSGSNISYNAGGTVFNNVSGSGELFAFEGTGNPGSGVSNAINMRFTNTNSTSNKTQFYFGGGTSARQWNFGTDPYGAGDNTMFIYSIGGTTMPIYLTSNGKVRLGRGSISTSGLANNYSLIVDNTDAIQLPSGTTGQRPGAIASLLRYNSTLGAIEGYDTRWFEIPEFAQSNLILKSDPGTGISAPVNVQILNENATNGKTQFTFGSNATTTKRWALGSDIWGNGNNDFFLYSDGGATTAMYITQDGRMRLGYSGLVTASLTNSYTLQVDGTNAIGFPRGTVAQRPTIASSTTPFRYNTDSTALEYGESVGTWRQLATRAYARSMKDGNGIYSGSGTVPDETRAFVGASNKFQIGRFTGGFFDPLVSRVNAMGLLTYPSIGVQALIYRDSTNNTASGLFQTNTQNALSYTAQNGVASYTASNESSTIGSSLVYSIATPFKSRENRARLDSTSFKIVQGLTTSTSDTVFKIDLNTARTGVLRLSKYGNGSKKASDQGLNKPTHLAAFSPSGTGQGTIVDYPLDSIPSVNIYNSNGTLTDNRTIIGGGNSLTASGLGAISFSGSGGGSDYFSFDMSPGNYDMQSGGASGGYVQSATYQDSIFYNGSFSGTEDRFSELDQRPSGLFYKHRVPGTFYAYYKVLPNGQAPTVSSGGKQNLIWAGNGSEAVPSFVEVKRDTTIKITDVDYDFSAAITTAQIAARYNRIVIYVKCTSADGANNTITLHTPDVNLAQCDIIIHSIDDNPTYRNDIDFTTNGAVSSTGGTISTYNLSAGEQKRLRVVDDSGYKYFFGY